MPTRTSALAWISFGFIHSLLAREKAIAKFEAADQEKPAPQNATLFVGSSSIRGWKLETSWPDRVTINRGFGGSTIADSIHFFDRIIAHYKPKTIVLYAGDNDVSRGLNAKEVVADFMILAALVEKELPNTRLVYIAIKPSIKRWNMWPAMKAANDAIAEYCSQKKNLVFADIAAPMLKTADGKPNPDVFADDGLHLNDAGYAMWKDVIDPLLK